VCGIAIAVSVILLWGAPGYGVTTINHQGAYAVIVLFIALCALAVTYLPWPAAALLLVGNAAWFAVSWVPGLGFTPAATDETRPMMQFSPAMLLVCLAGVIMGTAAIAWLRFAGEGGQNLTVVQDEPPSLDSSSWPGISSELPSR